MRPDRVPQMTDTEMVVGDVLPQAHIPLQALVPNRKGLERAIASGIGGIAIFVSASERHSRSNINSTIEEAFARSAEVAAQAHDANLQVRGYLSMVWGSPDEPDMPIKHVVNLSRQLHEMGCDEVALGDTTGVAVPTAVQAVIKAVSDELPLEQVALHMHDTRGTALANVLAGMEAGIRTFDGAIGGLGGCPFAPGASGNLATEDLVLMMHGMGVTTGVDLDVLIETALWIEGVLGRKLASRSLRSLGGAYPGDRLQPSHKDLAT